MIFVCASSAGWGKKRNPLVFVPTTINRRNVLVKEEEEAFFEEPVL